MQTGAKQSPTVTVYGRPGCHLCEDAITTLKGLSASRSVPFSIHEINIEDDDALHAQMLERIPVIEVAGEQLCDYIVDEQKVLQALETAA